jgi:hypothetical protein
MLVALQEDVRSEENNNDDDADDDDVDQERDRRVAGWPAAVESYCKELVELVAVNSVSQTGAAAVSKLTRDRFSAYLPLEPELPATMYSILKYAHKGNPAHAHSPSELQVVCPQKDCCVIELDDVLTKNCTHCNARLLYDDNTPRREMLVTDVRDRIKRFYAQPTLARALKYPVVRTKGEGDIWDARLLRNMSEDEMMSTAQLIITCDASVFKKGKSVSYTPVVASWANLPPWLRFSRAGVLFLGLLPEKVCTISISYLYCSF